MKTTTLALLSLLLAASGLLLSISAQESNATISEALPVVFSNQTIPVDSAIDGMSADGSSGLVDPSDDNTISVIAAASSGEGNAIGVAVP